MQVADGLDPASSVELIMHKLHDWTAALIVMLPNLAVAAVVLAVAVLASRVLPRFVYGLMKRATHNESMSRLVGSVCRLACVIAGIMTALGLLRLDRAVTSLLAGVGVIGLALGFAFQDIAANFMSGFMMTMNRPFNVGDIVELAGHKCRIKRLELRVTEVETLDGLSILVPNKQVFQNPIINYTRTTNRRMALKVGTAYANDMEKVRSVAIEALGGVPHRDPDREVEVFFEEFGDSSINFEVRVWLVVSEQLAFLEARSEAMIALKRAFDQNDITIPFPIRTLDFGAKLVGGERLDAMQLGQAARTPEPAER